MTSKLKGPPAEEDALKEFDESDYLELNNRDLQDDNIKVEQIRKGQSSNVAKLLDANLIMNFP